MITRWLLAIVLGIVALMFTPAAEARDPALGPIRSRVILSVETEGASLCPSASRPSTGIEPGRRVLLSAEFKNISTQAFSFRPTMVLFWVDATKGPWFIQFEEPETTLAPGEWRIISFARYDIANEDFVGTAQANAWSLEPPFEGPSNPVFIEVNACP